LTASEGDLDGLSTDRPCCRDYWGGVGIGLATTKTFLPEGAKVVAADLDPSAAGELFEQCVALTVDMSTPTAQVS